MAVDIFDVYCYSVLHTIKYHLLNRMIEDLGNFETLYFFDSSPYEHSNVHIEHYYGKTSKRRHTRMMKTVNVLREVTTGLSNTKKLV